MHGIMVWSRGHAFPCHAHTLQHPALPCACERYLQNADQPQQQICSRWTPFQQLQARYVLSGECA